MEKFREFQGRDLDECIKAAMEWFDGPRESLEVEIVQDAKSGIFGIVGARKAKIRARRAQVAQLARDLLGSAADHDGRASRAEQARASGAGKSGMGAAKPAAGQAKGAPCNGAGAQARSEPPDAGEPREDVDAELDGEEACDISGLDRGLLEARALEIAASLIRPLAGRDVSAQMDLDHGKPHIKVEWEGDAGILIGREGQTLAALQYMISRLLSRAMGAPLNVRLDIGEYRARQDDRLREMAFALADKARRAGRPFSTRPLSSYHRRIVHLCLRNERDLVTRSSGDGPLKRVLISPRRG